MSMIQQQSQTISLRVGALQQRLQDLELQVDTMTTEIPLSVEKQWQKISQELQRLTQDFQQEKKERFTREGWILKQIHDYETSITQTIKHEREERRAKLDQLRSILEQNESGRVDSDTRFAALLEQELSALKAQLQREIEERQVEDDAIVDAMNRYTTKLQSTLNVITSDD